MQNSLHISLSVLLLCVSTSGVAAQEKRLIDNAPIRAQPIDTSVSTSSVPDSTSPATWKLALASLPPAFTIGGALYQNWDTYWRHDGAVAFHFSTDPPYALHNDKLGHAYYTAMSADVIRKCYELAGVRTRTAVWLGSGFAFATEFLVEIEDGFHTGTDYYGFSPGDAAADLAGAALPLGKEYIPALRNVDYKISMWRSEALRRGAYKDIFDDDESHFYWISYDVHDGLHAVLWPKWLNVTLGYGVEHLESSRYAFPEIVDYTPRSQLYLGPDLNLKGLPITGGAWYVIAELLSHVKVPFPALQVAPRIKWWWLR